MSHQLKGVRGPHGQGQEAARQPDAEDDQSDNTAAGLHSVSCTILHILSPGLSLTRLLGQGVDDGLIPVQADCHQCPYAGVNLSNQCKLLQIFDKTFYSDPYSKFSALY